MNKKIIIAMLAVALSPAAFARPTSTPVVRDHSVSVHDHTQPVRTHSIRAPR